MKSETREALATAIGIWLIIILLMFGFGYLLLRPPFGYRVDNVVGLITAVILGFQLVVFGRQAMRLHENVEATRDSIELANREFIATHRPRTLVQSVMIADRGSSRDKSNGLIDFMLANAGEARARVTSYQIFPYVKDEDAAFTPFMNQPEFKFPTELVIDPGKLVLMRAECRSFELRYDDFLNSEGARLFIVGRIQYEGSDRIGRVTGICREYSRSTGMWRAVKESEYEYAY